MFDVVVLILIFSFVWSLLLLATSGLVTVMEHLYCSCKPTYNFTSYLPSNIFQAMLWPVVLPLLLIELVYIITYCTTIKLRNYL